MSVVTATISKQGTVMDPTYELMSIDIEREVNRVPRCELQLIDGDLAKATFPISDGELFALGGEIEVKLRRGDEKDATVFKGLVVRHALQLRHGASSLIVELRDRAIKLTRPRRSAVHTKISDDALIKQLAAPAVTVKKIPKTSPKHPEIVQFGASDWDFMLARAEANGLVVVVHDGELSAAPLAVTGKARAFELGKDTIYGLDIAADGGSLYHGIEAVAWDQKGQKATDPSKAAIKKIPMGGISGRKVARALGFDTCTLRQATPLDPDELQAWADGQMARARMATIRGRLSTAGAADLTLLEAIELKGTGKRFTGKSLITGLRHRVDKGGWRTDIQFGARPETHAERFPVDEPPAAGLLPAVPGLQLGVVADFEKDKSGELRVRVIVPGIDDKAGKVWARLASPDAGKDRGFYFRPEKGDEVVLGFLAGDPRQAIILGSLYGSKNTGPAEFKAPDQKNLGKGIVTRKGVTIAVVDDDKPKIEVKTPAGKSLVLDEDKDLIKLEDDHGNSVLMDKDGITITSAKDVTIDGSSGDVVIKGSKVDVQ